MRRLRLNLQSLGASAAYRFVRPGGAVDTLPALRLVAFVRLLDQVARDPDARDYAFLAAPVDTGATLSIVSESLRQHLRPGVVTWLPFAPGTPAADKNLAVAGRTFPYDLGELTLHLHDQSGGQLAVRTVAKFTRDGGRHPFPLILGLRGGLLDGRRLVAEPDPAALFGQSWTVEGP